MVWARLSCGCGDGCEGKSRSRDCRAGRLRVRTWLEEEASYDGVHELLEIATTAVAGPPLVLSTLSRSRGRPADELDPGGCRTMRPVGLFLFKVRRRLWPFLYSFLLLCPFEAAWMVACASNVADSVRCSFHEARENPMSP